MSKRQEKSTEKVIRGSVFLLFLTGAFTSSMSLIPLSLPIEKSFVYIWFFASLILVLLMSSSTIGVFVIPTLVFQLGYVFEEMAIKLTDSIASGSFNFKILLFFVISVPVIFLVSAVSINSSRRIREAVQSTEAKSAALSRLI